jgi:hypothetical protein
MLLDQFAATAQNRSGFYERSAADSSVRGGFVEMLRLPDLFDEGRYPFEELRRRLPTWRSRSWIVAWRA